MNSIRTIIGVVISTAWFVAIAYLVHRDTSGMLKLNLNEWGDFFAGCFAPLAFLWLVLGYLQQGDELRLSSEALNMQAAELKNSVDQQRELVEVSRQQLENAQNALAHERQENDRRSKPKFTLSGNYYKNAAYGPDTNFTINVRNTGYEATAVQIDFYPNYNISDSSRSFAIFKRGQETTFTFIVQTIPPLFKLSITATDGLEREILNTYSINTELGTDIGKVQFTSLDS